ncbi:MAG: aldehyde-activating protein [Ponticaulis sp.]|nr:aldehyde-activating protein [Ponticaulis sp.]
MSDNEMSWHAGGCHCGAVRFEVQLPDRIEVEDCNCSVCLKSQNAHIIVPGSRFRLLSGADQLTTYTFNTGVAKHQFCSVCGIKSFYIPRSNPDGFAVTWRCLDDPTAFEHVALHPFDGVHWEQNAAGLADKSKS